MIDLFFEKVRLWQTCFETGLALPNLPVPGIIAEEAEDSPAYVENGVRRRRTPGGQFVITLQGRGMIRIGDRSYSLTPGRTFLHNHNDPAVCYYYPKDGKEPWRFLWMSLEGENVRPLISDIIKRSGYLYDVPLEGDLVKLLFSFRGKKRQVRFLAPLEAAELALSALRMLCSPRKEELQSAGTSLTGRVLNAIAAEYRQQLHTAELAQRFGVSREHLSRTFRKETGMTLRDCLNKVRMKAAAELLNHTRLSVKEIAAQCGFEEYSVFFRSFRHYYKLSPGESRRRHLEQ